MLVWSTLRPRLIVGAPRAVLIGVLFIAPLAVILAASFAGQWNGVCPSAARRSSITLDAVTAPRRGTARQPHHRARRERSRAPLRHLGGAGACALKARRRERMLDLLFFIPSAVPSVSVGLGLLVAFSQPPLLLNGTISDRHASRISS